MSRIRDGIFQTAQALGVKPVDLATIISYETAGTFDPVKRGPRTQWGQHRGLIQFGESQARRYGVNWGDPISSQLGKAGAVYKYMHSAGVRPGMGMLDMYSAVNAGRVGRYNASDAKNGGAWGTVRDKVNHQMGGHRRKAMRMFAKYQPRQAAELPKFGGAQGQGQPSIFGGPQGTGATPGTHRAARDMGLPNFDPITSTLNKPQQPGWRQNEGDWQIKWKKGVTQF